MNSIEKIKKKKLEEIQNTLGKDIQKQLEEQAKAQEQLAMVEGMAKQHMTKDAAERYGRLKLAHPAHAINAIALIAQAAQMGQLNEKITDKEFKSLLEKLQEGKKEFTFKR